MESDFDTLSRILGKLTGANFFGKFTFNFHDGKIVHTEIQQTKKPLDLQKLLDTGT